MKFIDLIRNLVSSIMCVTLILSFTSILMIGAKSMEIHLSNLNKIIWFIFIFITSFTISSEFIDREWKR